MRIIINLLLLIVMALNVWDGYRRGLIRAIVSLLALIVALILGNVLSSAYSGEIVPALSPFIGGFVDSDATTTEVVAKLGYADSDYSLTDIVENDPSLKNDYAYESMRCAGFYSEVSEDLAKDAVAISERNNISMPDAVTTVICNSAAYVGCITIAFIMLIILLTTILDLINFEFRLPNIEIVDEVGGSAIGLIKGFIYCVLISWLLGFLGIIIGKSTSDSCALLHFFQAFRFITRSLI